LLIIVVFASAKMVVGVPYVQ